LFVLAIQQGNRSIYTPPTTTPT